ncbi:hypothetical protein ACTI_00610 [Actinoplanes sp. OR16]|uniref:helix-turn-helix domain-containing protein n=1 Tax=Actinoplanes sp. OR16 TaxID=946334 RepID=UPI000F6DF5B3|nr:helix-turn-helix domain-containing protein [Actinoplanes sp. OR16]BBH63376.1 hypothetical protein ACTI_00610 [Actinoplanes sp. OR16]
MQATLNTTALAPRDREEAVRTLVWDSVIRVEIEHHVSENDMSVSLGLGRCGDLGVCHTTATPTTVRRTARLAREDTEPVVFLGLQRSGSSIVVQHGREAVLRPGEFAIYDTSSPYSLLFAGGIDATFFRIPRAALALPEPSVREASAVRFGRGDRIAALTSDYLTRLAEEPDLLTDALATPTIELIRAALTVRLGADRLARRAMGESLATRILADIRQHLSDPDLSPAAVAARQHISVRYLHRVLQGEGVRFGAWVRRRRLEGTRRDLADPASRAATVAAIARRWGFSDPAHFSKSFRTEYGLTPRDWRALHL